MNNLPFQLFYLLINNNIEHNNLLRDNLNKIHLKHFVFIYAIVLGIQTLTHLIRFNYPVNNTIYYYLIDLHFTLLIPLILYSIIYLFFESICSRLFYFIYVSIITLTIILFTLDDVTKYLNPISVILIISSFALVIKPIIFLILLIYFTSICIGLEIYLNNNHDIIHDILPVMVISFLLNLFSNNALNKKNELLGDVLSLIKSIVDQNNIMIMYKTFASQDINYNKHTEKQFSREEIEYIKSKISNCNYKIIVHDKSFTITKHSFRIGDMYYDLYFFKDSTLKYVQNKLHIANYKLKELQSFNNVLQENISHNIKTPINNIVGLMYLLENQIEDTLYVVKNVNYCCFKLNDMIDKILLLSLLESGLIVNYPTKTTLNTWLSTLIYEFNTCHENVQITYQCVPEIDIFTDLKLLKYMMYELIDNSLKFSSNNKTEIICQSNSSSVIFDIINIGPQINEQELTKIYNKFYKSNYESTDYSLGIGLYIAICISRILKSRLKISNYSTTGVKASVVLDKENRQSLEKINIGDGNSKKRPDDFFSCKGIQK